MAAEGVEGSDEGMTELDDGIELIRAMPGIRPNEHSQEWMESVIGLLHSGNTSDYSEDVVMAVTLMRGEPWMTEFRKYLILDGSPDIVKILKGIELLVKLKRSAGNDKRRCENEVKKWVLPLLSDLADPGATWIRKTLREHLAQPCAS